MKKLILSILISVFLFGSVIFAQKGTTTPAQPAVKTAKKVTLKKKAGKKVAKKVAKKKIHKHKKQKKMK
jgi:hypothetical protein